MSIRQCGLNKNWTDGQDLSRTGQDRTNEIGLGGNVLATSLKPEEKTATTLENP